MGYGNCSRRQTAAAAAVRRSTNTDTAESLSLMLQNHHLLALLWTLPLDSSLMLLVLHCLLEHACEATINISRAKPELLEARSVYLTAYFGRSVKYCEN